MIERRELVDLRRPSVLGVSVDVGDQVAQLVVEVGEDELGDLDVAELECPCSTCAMQDVPPSKSRTPGVRRDGRT